MDPQTRQRLAERVRKEVEIILREGVQPYLRGLSPTALLEAVENEVRFLGLYAQSDTEAPGIIHAILEEHLDAWRHAYLIPAFHDTAALTHTYTSTASGIARPQGTYYVGFLSSVDQLRIHQGHAPIEETRR